MIYQVRATLFFDKEDEAKDAFHDCEKALAKSVVVNPESENRERPRVELLKCYHDEVPTRPCVITDCLTSET